MWSPVPSLLQFSLLDLGHGPDGRGGGKDVWVEYVALKM